MALYGVDCNLFWRDVKFSDVKLINCCQDTKESKVFRIYCLYCIKNMKFDVVTDYNYVHSFCMKYSL